MKPLHTSEQTLFLTARALFICLSFLFLFSIPLASAVTWNIDHITVTTNASLYWVTDSLGALGDVNASQFTSVNGSLNINASWVESVDTNISINYGANESDVSGPAIPFLLTSEGILKMEVTEATQSAIWEQVVNEIRNMNGDVLNFSGSIIASGNSILDNRFFLGNNASWGYNDTCAQIFWNTDGSVLETKGCS